MSRNIVSLQPSGSFVEFSCQLGSLYRFELDWNTSFSYFMVTIKNSNGERIIAGRGLHVGTNIMDGVRDFSGTLTIEGEKPTPENLGTSCKLVWER